MNEWEHEYDIIICFRRAFYFFFVRLDLGKEERRGKEDEFMGLLAK